MPPSSALTRDAIFAIARGLPPGPRVFAEFDQRLRDESTSLEEMAALIKRDRTLTAQLIRMSNSVVYGSEQRTGAVDEAVARVGYRELYRLAGYVAGAQLADRSLRHYGIDAEQLRENMLETAFLGERLAEASGVDVRMAYTAGLMRSLGLLILDRLADHYPELEPYHPIRDSDYLSWEGRMFGLSSCEIAALVLEEWSFPVEIVEAVRGQYLRNATDRDSRLTLVLNLAAGLVADGPGSLLGESVHWGGAAEKAARLGLSADQLATAARHGREAFAHFQNRMAGGPGASAPASTESSGRGSRPNAGSAAPQVAPAPPAGRDASKEVNDSCNFSADSGVLAPNNEPCEPNDPAGAMSPVDFATFMRNYQDMVYSTAVRLLGNEAQAEDISQEVFLKAYERFDDLSSSPTAGGWLKTVATNLSLNHLQRYRKRWRFFSELVRPDEDGGGDEPVEFPAADTDLLAQINQSDRRAWVERALERLPEHQRVPLVLYHFEDQPYDEIARRLRVSLAKVKIDILRGRAALAQILARSATSHETLQAER